MRQHLSNVFYGVLDYAAYPAAMLLAAPVVLHNLGVEAYGVWSVMTAVVSAGSILAAGFGDANIKHVNEHRGTGNHTSLVAAVRALLGLNVSFAGIAAVCVLLLAPVASRRIVPDAGVMQADCLLCLRLSALLIAFRAVESVCISTQRAYERYGAAARISVAARLLSLVAGAALTYMVHRVAIILVVTVMCNAVATAFQFRSLRALLGLASLRPAFDAQVTRSMLRFGAYSWLLAASGVVFGQMDRLVLGVWLGAAPLAAYALCTQIAQPIYGLAAAGLHFLFPYLANRSATESPSDLRYATALAAGCNLLFVAVTALALQVLGPRVLVALGRGTMDAGTSRLLTPILWGTALLGLSVTPTYALYAFNRIRLVTVVNVGGATLWMTSMLWFGRAWGMQGIAWARIGYGAAALMLYLPLVQLLRRPRPTLAVSLLGDRA